MPFDAASSDLPLQSLRPESAKDAAQDAKSSASDILETSVADQRQLVDWERTLPDDLQALAEQLGEDALHLSALYPARAVAQWREQSQTPIVEPVPATSPNSRISGQGHFSRWSKLAIAVASLLVVASIAWQPWDRLPAAAPRPVPAQMSPARPTLMHTAAEKARQAAAEKLLVLQPVSSEMPATGRVAGDPRSDQPALPAGLFISLSGPEQEAMLDLMEDARLQQPSVSF